VAAAAASSLLLWGVFGGSQGLFALALGQREKGLLRREIQALALQNRELEQRIERLSRHPEDLERAARERLLLKRPGEIVYRFH
jgi:cell division protein FtsB